MTRETCQIESGTVVENYRAGWTDAGGTRRRQGFSIDKYGEEVARRMALKARRDGEVVAAKERRPFTVKGAGGIVYSGSKLDAIHEPCASPQGSGSHFGLGLFRVLTGSCDFA